MFAKFKSHPTLSVLWGGLLVIFLKCHAAKRKTNTVTNTRLDLSPSWYDDWVLYPGNSKHMQCLVPGFEEGGGDKEKITHTL